MHTALTTTEVFLIAIALIFTVPYLIWRLSNTDYYAPLVVVQIITGILLGPGILGKAFPRLLRLLVHAAGGAVPNGIAWWGVILFVWIAGIELDLKKAWLHRRESMITAGLAVAAPLLLGSLVAGGMLMQTGWIGPKAMSWQFILGIGMACAVTALPILILLMEKLQILRQPIGQRILRYASVDDIAIWGVLALILMEWHRIGMQAMFFVAFAAGSYGFRTLMIRLPPHDRWFVGLTWLGVCVRRRLGWPALHGWRFYRGWRPESPAVAA